MDEDAEDSEEGEQSEASHKSRLYLQGFSTDTAYDKKVLPTVFLF